jgi:hypothetical protein
MPNIRTLVYCFGPRTQLRSYAMEVALCQRSTSEPFGGWGLRLNLDHHCEMEMSLAIAPVDLSSLSLPK